MILVCVCVFSPIYSGRQTCGRTSRGHTGILVHLSSVVFALICFARRIQLVISLVDLEVEFLCVNELFVLHLLLTAPGFELTSQRQKVSRLSTEPPGRPASCRPLNW